MWSRSGDSKAKASPSPASWQHAKTKSCPCQGLTIVHRRPLALWGPGRRGHSGKAAERTPGLQWEAWGRGPGKEGTCSRRPGDSSYLLKCSPLAKWAPSHYPPSWQRELGKERGRDEPRCHQGMKLTSAARQSNNPKWEMIQGNQTFIEYWAKASFCQESALNILTKERIHRKSQRGLSVILFSFILYVGFFSHLSSPHYFLSIYL